MGSNDILLRKNMNVVGTTLMASSARAKQCAVLIMASIITRDRSRKIMDGTRPMNWATDAINVVPTTSITVGRPLQTATRTVLISSLGLVLISQRFSTSETAQVIGKKIGEPVIIFDAHAGDMGCQNHVRHRV